MERLRMSKDECNILEANIKLQNKNKELERENKILSKYIRILKKIVIRNNYEFTDKEKEDIKNLRDSL